MESSLVLFPLRVIVTINKNHHHRSYCEIRYTMILWNWWFLRWSSYFNLTLLQVYCTYDIWLGIYIGCRLYWLWIANITVSYWNKHFSLCIFYFIKCLNQPKKKHGLVSVYFMHICFLYSISASPVWLLGSSCHYMLKYIQVQLH